MNKGMEMGRRIVDLRHRRGMTQEQLGQQVNVSAQAVSKWENGDSLPDTPLLVSLARALGCTTDYLLGADAMGGIDRFIPALEAEARRLEPGQKIDFAFRLFHLVDEMSFVHAQHAMEQPEPGQPFVHAGPDGVTVWWKGKFICSSSIEALRETERIWKDPSLPIDLFSEDWDSMLSALLSQSRYFGSDMAINEGALREGAKLDSDFDSAINEFMDSGLIKKGKGGYRIGIKGEVLFRLMGVLLRATGKPGSISHASLQGSEEHDDSIS